MSSKTRFTKRKVIAAKVLFAMVMMLFALVAEGVIHGQESSTLSLLEGNYEDLSTATKALHFVVRLLTYSLPS